MDKEIMKTSGLPDYLFIKYRDRVVEENHTDLLDPIFMNNVKFLSAIGLAILAIIIFGNFLDSLLTF